MREEEAKWSLGMVNLNSENFPFYFQYGDDRSFYSMTNGVMKSEQHFCGCLAIFSFFIANVKVCAINRSMSGNDASFSGQ